MKNPPTNPEAPTRETDRDKVRSAVLTLRLTQAEMLRFKLAALTLGKKRAQLVREGVAQLIGGAAPITATPAGAAASGDTVAKGEAAGCLVTAGSQAGATG